MSGVPAALVAVGGAGAVRGAGRDRRGRLSLTGTAAPLERGFSRGGGAESRRAAAGPGRGAERGAAERRAPARRLLGLLPPWPALPGRAAGRRRCALGTDRPRRPWLARRTGAARRGDDRRRPPRHLLRARDLPRTGAGAGTSGD